MPTSQRILGHLLLLDLPIGELPNAGQAHLHPAPGYKLRLLVRQLCTHDLDPFLHPWLQILSTTTGPAMLGHV